MSLFTARLATLPAPRMKVTAPPPAQTSLSRLIPARETPFGSLHLVEHEARLPTLNAESLSALALSETLLDTTHPFFFDTETTGLMGGTGTLAFLLGTAHALDDGRFVVSQLHLPSPAHERPMLEWLADRLTRATVLLSFNGKSFDWPLLRARFVMNRLPPPPELPHVDLLHCARRVFRHHLDELTLGSLERRVLDVHRRGDIEGAQIPPAWFDFLRTGRVATLGRVLSHNERDVRSMVDLVQRLIAAWEERHPLLPPTALGLAQVAMRSGDEPRALRFLERAQSGGTASQAWSLRAEVHRRKGRWVEAVEALHHALEGSDDPAPLHLRLAILYEHRLRDVAAATRHAEQGTPVDVRALARRARLERKRAVPELTEATRCADTEG